MISDIFTKFIHSNEITMIIDIMKLFNSREVMTDEYTRVTSL